MSVLFLFLLLSFRTAQRSAGLPKGRAAFFFSPLNNLFKAADALRVWLGRMLPRVLFFAHSDDFLNDREDFPARWESFPGGPETLPEVRETTLQGFRKTFRGYGRTFRV